MAGRSDEGWVKLNNLEFEFSDVFSQVDIANQQRVFLQKEKNFRKALVFSLWTICKEVQRDLDNCGHSNDMADFLSDEGIDFGNSNVPVSTTRNGTENFDSAYNIFQERILERSTVTGLEKLLLRDVKKAKIEHALTVISTNLCHYIRSSQQYKLNEVRDLLEQSINESSISNPVSETV
ncbi:hypothetical protein [Thalassotalea sp. PS06]|uniref:hypothetical protein n=1 Tax=Thalassotalea sp. PS06 TaxID=2594005 RepID=UPI001163CBC2|nr:hypothetical protein [Thalassotalea sp. PS06]QDP01815.1 hypothetical protein FNC98_10965 [Thalassotalea sp. PS06]